MDSPRLERNEGGKAVVEPDKDGVLRYVYADGTLDSSSTVDMRGLDEYIEERARQSEAIDPATAQHVGNLALRAEAA